jgi:hypothetical protein
MHEWKNEHLRMDWNTINNQSYEKEIDDDDDAYNPADWEITLQKYRYSSSASGHAMCSWFGRRY